MALRGTLATEIQDRPGSLDHPAPQSHSRDELFAIRQTVTIKPRSCLAGAVGAGEIKVNSLHRQAVDPLGTRSRSKRWPKMELWKQCRCGILAASQ